MNKRSRDSIRDDKRIDVIELDCKERRWKGGIDRFLSIPPKVLTASANL